MRATPVVSTILLLAALLLGACTREGPPAAGIPGMQLQLQRFYLDRATEKGGMCTSPVMRTITRTTVLEETDSEKVLRVRYFWENFELMPFSGAGRCQGFAERDFTLARMPDGSFEVVDMTGERRQVRQNFGRR